MNICTMIPQQTLGYTEVAVGGYTQIPMQTKQANVADFKHQAPTPVIAGAAQTVPSIVYGNKFSPLYPTLPALNQKLHGGVLPYVVPGAPLEAVTIDGMAAPLSFNMFNTLPLPLTAGVKRGRTDPALFVTDKRRKGARSSSSRKVTKCKNAGCSKNSRGKSGLCVSHGGGRRCSKCKIRSARPYSEFCSAHGGGRRCQEANCMKGAVNKTDYCRRHRK